MAAIAYAPAMAGGFYLDDLSILADPAFTTVGGVLDLLNPARVRPLTNLTLWANYQLNGDSPFGYHLVNLLLHLVAVWFAHRALSLLLPPVAALLAVTAFALHPLQTEPVAYIFARSTVLCGLFSWVAIDAWVRGRAWWAVLATAAALSAKEEAIALPLFFGLLQLTVPENLRQWRPVTAMFGLALATGVRGLVATAQIAGSGAALGTATSPLDYAIAQGEVIVRYLRLFVIPIGLNFDPDILTDPWTSAAFWCGLFGAALYLYRTSPPASFWFAAGLIFLAPTSSILPIDDLAADRRMYLAVPCFAATAALLLPTLKTANIAVLGALLAVLTFTRATVFRTAESLWRETVAASPGKVRPRIQLSRAVPPQEALTLLADLKNDARVAAERGRIYMDLQRPAEALREFGVVLAAEPGDPRALSNRGTALAALNQIPAAQQDFRRALERDPCLFPALLNLRRLGQPVPGTANCAFTAAQQAALK